MSDLTPDKMLGMSDEDFLNLNEPPQDTGATEEEPGSQDNEEEGEDNTSPSNPDLEPEGEAGADGEGGEASPSQDADGEAEGEEGNSQDPSSSNQSADPEKNEQDGGTPDPTGSDNEDGTKKSEDGEKPGTDRVFQIPTSFKANGKTIELKNEEEALQLMQMGANYTRKMQDIAPHRKVLMMLQNNDLLNEDKLSYLIDLDKKNPEAIKKLIKDSGLDPMDIDVESEPAYSAGNHRVSDEEAAFRTVLEDVSSTQTGKELLVEINSTWDETSKEALWAQPQIMNVLQEQRDNGVYAVITAEMERQITLGKIAPGTPFLQAYKIVGDQLTAANGFANGGEQDPAGMQNPGNSPEPQPLAVRPAAPKSKLKNDERVDAAATTRTTPSKKNQEFVNPLAMSDDEFLKKFEGRV